MKLLIQTILTVAVLGAWYWNAEYDSHPGYTGKWHIGLCYVILSLALIAAIWVR